VEESRTWKQKMGPVRRPLNVIRNTTDRLLVGEAIQIYLVSYTDTYKEAVMSETRVRLDRVRELLGADTETEAVDQALSALLLREELIAGVRRVAGSGGVENVFSGDVEP